MNKSIVFLLWIMACSLSSHAQLLLNRSSQQIEDELIFNKSFLLNNNIKSIKAEYMVKKDWQGLTKYGVRYEYSFDEAGNLVYKKEIKEIANKTEVEEILYHYNIKNQLVEEKTSRGEGFSIKEYQYEDDKIVEVINYLEGREPENAKRMELNRQHFIWKTINDSTIQKHVANNFGQPYLTITYRYDSEMKYLKQEVHRLIVTGEKQEIEYEYNNIGWLSKVTINNKEINYLYDEFGNVVEVNQWENGNKEKHIEYLYKPNGLLEAQLKTEGSQTDIHILKYQIELY